MDQKALTVCHLKLLFILFYLPFKDRSKRRGKGEGRKLHNSKSKGQKKAWQCWLALVLP
jgi:hypothetical protein